MKILCTADVHIGRRPSRLPPQMGRSFSCAEAWLRVVALAIDEQVDLVAVSGDLVDRDNRYYEAVGPLERGLRQLDEAGITTAMVAGNHDYDVLPRLVDTLDFDTVKLLGRGGRWERFTVARDGETLHLDGWSFPAAEVLRNPLDDYASPAHATEPVLRLLHADLDQRDSRYAPVTLGDLRRYATGFWLLGHVHVPKLREERGCASVLYPGSPQAMDPGEPGQHGVWMLDTGPGGFTCREVPLSPVRYETVTVDVDGIDDGAMLDARVVDALRTRLASAVENADALRYLCCRLRVIGRTALHPELERRLSFVEDDFELSHGEAIAVVDRVDVETRAPHDLEALARGSDPPSVIARLMLALDAGETTPELSRVLSSATRRVEAVRAGRAYDQLDAAPSGEPEIAIGLRRQAELLLDALLAGREQAA